MIERRCHPSWRLDGWSGFGCIRTQYGLLPICQADQALSGEIAHLCVEQRLIRAHLSLLVRCTTSHTDRLSAVVQCLRIWGQSPLGRSGLASAIIDEPLESSFLEATAASRANSRATGRSALLADESLALARISSVS